MLSARLTSSQLCAAHSQITSALLWPKTCPNKDLGAKASDPLYAASFCTEKLVHTEDCTHRSFYTGTGKLVHRETRKPLLTTSFYTEQAFTHSKLLRTQAFAHRSFYTEKLLHREAFTQRTFYTQQAFTHIEKPVHRKAFTHSKLSHKEAPTQKSLYTEKPAQNSEDLIGRQSWDEQPNGFGRNSFALGSCWGPLPICTVVADCWGGHE